MRRYDRLLLDVWREAGRHIGIGESTANIAASLVDHLPLSQTVVLHIDLQRSRLQTVANHSLDGQVHTFHSHQDLSPSQMKSLMSWTSRRQISGRRDENAESVFDIIAPDADTASALAGPLWGTEQVEGVLILFLSPATLCTEEHGKLAQSLLEPFGTALEIDRRLHEIEALRDRAEADRRTLLTKLGRKEMNAPIVGAEAGLRNVMERIETISASDVTVLLLGETGTGKEVVARAIHNRSGRHDGPFIRVNCGAIPPELIDSQLFGHERGSFTGAIDTRQGWFERADGGTLFLDEIAELPLAAQVRLLRVLQDGFIERVGGQHSIHVDVRVIAATHRNVAQMIQHGTFRQDLWYRIAVFPIPIPPLRDRPEDIHALACHFAEKAATRFGLSLVMPTPEDIRLLCSYPWPGNIRELAAVIDRAALLGNGRRLEIAVSLGATVPTSTAIATSPAATIACPATLLHDASVPSGGSKVQPLDTVIKQCIEHALRECKGRIEGPFGAAKQLQVDPHTLRSRMRKYGIDWRSFRTSD